MRSIISLSLLHLAISPVFFVATAAAKCDDSKAATKAFDPKSLTLREVGARNTVVSRRNFYIIKSTVMEYVD
jgi:inorganic pyrophosphatase